MTASLFSMLLVCSCSLCSTQQCGMKMSVKQVQFSKKCFGHQFHSFSIDAVCFHSFINVCECCDEQQTPCIIYHTCTPSSSQDQMSSYIFRVFVLILFDCSQPILLRKEITNFCREKEYTYIMIGTSYTIYEHYNGH